MYESFYSLKDKPFSLIPDPQYLYLGRRHQAALLMLKLALSGQVGFSTMTGDVGSGKTTIARHFLDLAIHQSTIGLITSTHKHQGDILPWILSAFNLDHKQKNKVELFETFVDFIFEQFAKGKPTILLIDEAQNLSASALEELRVFSNIYDRREHVLQIILIGQPELLETLSQPDLRQLAQRISVNFHLGPLNVGETAAYIRHRLMIAGASSEIFDEAASSAVYYFTGGIPRLINLLCDYSLLYAFAERRPKVSHEIVWSVVCDKRESGLNVFQNTEYIGDRKKAFREILKLSTEINIAESDSLNDSQPKGQGKVHTSLGSSDLEPQSGNDNFEPELDRHVLDAGRRAQHILRSLLVTILVLFLLGSGLAVWFGEDLTYSLFQFKETAVILDHESMSEPAHVGDLTTDIEPGSNGPESSLLQSTDNLPGKQRDKTFDQLVLERDGLRRSTVNPRELGATALNSDQEATYLSDNKLAEEVTLPHQSLAELFKLQRHPHALEDASGILLSLWGFSQTKISKKAPCEQAAAVKLACLVEPASLKRLSAYNRPAIITLRTPSRELFPVVLSAFENGNVTLRASNITVVVRAEDIASKLAEDHVVFWKRPAIYVRLLQEGVSGSDVVWIKQRLADLKEWPRQLDKSDKFDGVLTERVKLFQKRHHLRPDGVVGPRTLITLNAATNRYGGPHLWSGSAN